MYKKNYFNFKKFNDGYLITNDFGCHAFLKENEFNKLKKNEKLSPTVLKKLEENLFVYTEDDSKFANIYAYRLKEYKEYLNESTVLHIFVVSKNCNYSCVYCQAGNLKQGNEFLMDEETAKRAVDIAFESPSQELSFEFQGGEPLTNFHIIKYIVDYSKGKAKECGKNISYNIVTNLSLLTNEIEEFILDNNISICTSIDGPEDIHNKNRPYKDGNSYRATVNNYLKLKNRGVQISALLTTTKESLKEYKKIVDEYVNLKQNIIWLRPLTRLGKAEKRWEEISYSAEEFLDYYKRALDYIIKINKKGYLLVEGFASLFLTKIINQDSINYMELRSPCGAAIGQLAYYYDGEIYTCDEGRMLAEMGDKKFLLGNVYDNSYKDLIKHKTTKEVVIASCLECSKICHSCVYAPYCGTCPVINYSNSGKMELNDREDFRCLINEGILNILFSYIQKDKSVYKIFRKWI